MYDNISREGNFGVGSPSDVDALSKALSTGYGVGVGRTGGAAFRVESLDMSLKTVSFSDRNIKLWKKIPKSPAYSTTEEYNEITSYGTLSSPFISEGASAPQATDASYIRRSKQMKYMGLTREVTHQATLVGQAHGDIIAHTNRTGILHLLQLMERYLFEGDSTLAFSGEAKQFDGFDALIDPANIIDLAGQPLQEADIEEAANLIVENLGEPGQMFASPRALSDLNKQMFPRGRVAYPAPENGRFGMQVTSMITNSGEVEFNADVFVRVTPTPPAAATSSLAPLSPASIAAGALTGSTGNHAKGAAAGTTYVNYLVTALNEFGESAPTAVQGATVTVSAANKSNFNYIPLTVTNPASVGSAPPEYFHIYRSVASTVNAVPASQSSYFLIAKVPASSQANSGTTVFNDLNLILPNTSSAYLGDMRPEVLTFRQLLPLMKMDLALTGPSFRWMILMYGAPILFARKKWMRFINIGTLSVR